MSKPRVIFVNRVYWPSEEATAQLLHDLSEALVVAGWPVELITAGDERDTSGAVRVHRVGGAPAHGGLISRTRNYLEFLRRARACLAAMLQPGDIVVPMTDPPLLGVAAAAAAREKGARVVHWVQDIYPEVVCAHAGAWLTLPLAPLRARRNAAWRAAFSCVTVGEEMREHVATQGIAPERVRVIENWAPRELDSLANDGEVAALRREWGLGGRFVVAYSGNLGRVHEFAAVLNAAAELRHEAAIAFVIIGSGARLAEVRNAVTARGLSNVLFFPPQPRARLAVTLAVADAHLVTLRAGFSHLVNPSKLAGVLAAGRPVLFVGVANGAIAHLLDTENCGRSFTSTDGAGLAAVVRRWQANPTALAALKANARLAYEKRFTLAAATAAWDALLARVANLPP